jgi:hypothetical protein
MSVYVIVGGLLVWSTALIAWAVWKNRAEPAEERSWEAGG